MADTYTCAACHETFYKDEAWSDADAAAECKEVFGVAPEEGGTVVICDTCWTRGIEAAKADAAKVEP